MRDNEMVLVIILAQKNNQNCIKYVNAKMIKFVALVIGRKCMIAPIQSNRFISSKTL